MTPTNVAGSPRAAAHPLVGRYLLRDEVVVYDKRPSLAIWFIDESIVLISFLLTAAIMAATSEPLIDWLGTIGLVALAVSFVRGFVDRLYTHYVLTDLRAIRVSGVLRRDHEWITWRKVTDVAVHQSAADRMAKTGTIRIESANEGMAFRAMEDIPDPQQFAREVMRLVHRTYDDPVEVTVARP